MDFLREVDEDSFIHLSVSDEVFAHGTRRSNFQDDRIWSLTPDETLYEECHHERIKSPERFCSLDSPADDAGDETLWTKLGWRLF